MTETLNDQPVLDRQYFDKELVAHLPRILKFTRQLTRDKYLADDILQTAVETALSKWEMFRPDAPMMPWMLKIVENCHYNYHRHTSRNALRRISLDTTLENILIDPLGDPAQNVEITFNVQTVTRVLSILPSMYRDVIVGFRYAELSHEELGRVLNCTPTASKLRLMRGTKRLKQVLASDLPLPVDLRSLAFAAQEVAEDDPYYPIAVAYQEILQLSGVTLN